MDILFFEEYYVDLMAEETDPAWYGVMYSPIITKLDLEDLINAGDEYRIY